MIVRLGCGSPVPASIDIPFSAEDLVSRSGMNPRGLQLVGQFLNLRRIIDVHSQDDHKI